VQFLRRAKRRLRDFLLLLVALACGYFYGRASGEGAIETVSISMVSVFYSKRILWLR